MQCCTKSNKRITVQTNSKMHVLFTCTCLFKMNVGFSCVKALLNYGRWAGAIKVQSNTGQTRILKMRCTFCSTMYNTIERKNDTSYQVIK